MAQNGSGGQEPSAALGCGAPWQCLSWRPHCRSGDVLLWHGACRVPGEAAGDAPQCYLLPRSPWRGHEAGTAPMGCPLPWLIISRPHHLLQGRLASSWTLPYRRAPFPAQPAARAATYPRTPLRGSAVLLQLHITPLSPLLMPADPKPHPWITAVPLPCQLALGLWSTGQVAPMWTQLAGGGLPAAPPGHSPLWLLCT